MIGSMDEHPPSRHCDCPECIGYFTSGARYYQPKLGRMQAEKRPHLRDPAFLKFMAKAVGDTLRNNPC